MDEKINSMSCEELDFHFKNTINGIKKYMPQLKQSNICVSKELQKKYNKSDDQTFDDLEIAEYYIDEFLYYYKTVKESIIKARILKIVLTLKLNQQTEHIPEELILLGCKKIKKI